MKRGFLALAILGLTAPVWAGAWGKAGVWDDGRAEVGIYDAERVESGVTVKFQEQLLIGKEPKKPKTEQVFKVTQVQRFDVGNYPVSYVTSYFVKEDPVREIVAAQVGYQDWNGATFKTLTVTENGMNGLFRSESALEQNQTSPVGFPVNKIDYFEDVLLFSLRALPFKEGYEEKIRLWSSLINAQGAPPTVKDATIKVELLEPVRSHAGTLPSWKVVVESPDGKDVYWFEKAEPHILTKMETKDGRKRLIYGRARWSYWDKRLPKPNILK